MSACTRLTLALLLVAAAALPPGRAQAQQAAPPRVNGLRVYHYSGQSFLRWESTMPPARQYTVYRSRRPLRTALALRQAEQRFVVQPGSAVNRRLSDAVQRPAFFRIPGPEGTLDANHECFVVTTEENERYYYAVTATGADGEYRQIRPGKNATASGVRERVAIPAAVFQGRFTVDGRSADVFTHWATDRDLPGYPAMSTIPSQPFNFAVQKNGMAGIHPLVLRLHGRGDNFLGNSNGGENPQEYVLALDDAMPGSGTPTFWFGYDRGIDIARRGRLPAVAPGQGVTDFTQRRIRWTLDWAVRKLPVDSARIVVAGVSMGGSGAAFFSLQHGSRIAAVKSFIPRLDFVYADSAETPQGRNSLSLFPALWGEAVRLPRMTDGRAVYEQLDFAGRLPVSDLSIFPPMILVAGKQDSVVGWRQLLPTLRVADSLATGMTALWDERGHSMHRKHAWSPQHQGIELARYRSDRSWPAFSRVSANAHPERDSVGSLNAAVTWFEPVIDEFDRWSVGITRAALEMRDSLFLVQGPLTADIVPRRLQRFHIQRGWWYVWTLTVGGRESAGGMLRAVRDDELRIPAVAIPDRRARLEIRPTVGPVFNR